MMRTRYSMPGVQALASALGGTTREDAYDREMQRQMDLDQSRSTIDANMAKAALANQQARQVDGQTAAHASRGSDDTLIRALMLRDPTIAPDAARAHVRRASGGPFAPPQFASPEQQRLAGETLGGLFASSLADKPTDGPGMADVMFNAGSSAQRLRAPELAADDPVTAAFMLNAGTGKDAPTLHSAMPGGLGTFGTLTGQMNINEPLQSSVVAENRAQANQANASAGASHALAGYRNAQTGMLGQSYDSNRGLIVDERTGQARPVTADGAPIGERKGTSPVTMNIEAKPLPAPALKMQQDELDAIGTSTLIDDSLRRVQAQIERGDLKLGTLTNIGSKARNAVGMSDENSRNFSSFMSALEKMRNDSLRLNTGVQTEGDAQRAWNELIANVNDEGVVRQRLAEIRQINQRATELRVARIKTLRDNFGAGPIDLAPFGVTEGQPAGDQRDGRRLYVDTGASMPQVTTAEEYEALPSGAVFLDPEGNERRKP